MNIKTYLDEHQISPAEFARTICVEAASVHRYITGERIPRFEILDRIIAATDGTVGSDDFIASYRARRACKRAA